MSMDPTDNANCAPTI